MHMHTRQHAHTDMHTHMSTHPHIHARTHTPPGFRALGLAMAEGDGKDGQTKWDMLALLPLFDPPRHDTKETIERCQQQVRYKLCCVVRAW